MSHMSELFEPLALKCNDEKIEGYLLSRKGMLLVADLWKRSKESQPKVEITRAQLFATWAECWGNSPTMPHAFLDSICRKLGLGGEP